MKQRAGTDSELSAVAAALRELDPDGSRIAQVLRNTFDQLYDGPRTGRYRWDQLYSTESRQAGNVFEINFQREFKFQDGERLDYKIAGFDVDCKYSQTCYWMIPPEALGHLCLVVWAEDSSDPRWSMGLLRVTPERLRTAARIAPAEGPGSGVAEIDGRFWRFATADDPPVMAPILPEPRQKSL